MKLNKIPVITACLALVVFVSVQCNPGKEEDAVNANSIRPVDLPQVVPGFHFPEDSNLIYSWMNSKQFPDNYDSASVYKHAWGVWAGLTSMTDQVYAGDSLLVFETWQGITEIREDIINGVMKDSVKKMNRATLEKPHQFQHGFLPGQKKPMVMAIKKNNDTIDVNAVNNNWVTVSYSPAAADYARQNKILETSVLNSYSVPGGYGNIPPFPQKAITIKPSYFVGSKTDSLIQIPIWTGAPATPAVYGANLWPRCVYADVHNRQQPNKALVPAAIGQTNPDSIAAATCNLSDFIYFNVDSAMAAHMNASDSTEDGPTFATRGSIAILVGMHVATKEINNWTWQSFYWDPAPGTPLSPSSSLAASVKPSQLRGAAAHYSLTTSYAMVLPNQPITGGSAAGATAMVGFNPYLEAGLNPFKAGGFPPGPPYYGVQTNCMSCHGRATVSGSLGYASDMYFSLTDTMFKNQVQVDFAWSINSTSNQISDAQKKSPK